MGHKLPERKRTIMNSAIFIARFSLAESDGAATTFAHDHVITYITNSGRMTSDFSGNSVIIPGLLIFRGKKEQHFAGFSGANSRKNRPISRDFSGRKVKIRRKIGRFRGILAEKSQISKDFQGQILRKIGRFHGKFRGETSPRNNP